MPGTLPGRLLHQLRVRFGVMPSKGLPDELPPGPALHFVRHPLEALAERLGAHGAPSRPSRVRPALERCLRGWNQHTEAWMAREHAVVRVRVEDLPREVERIARFLGGELSPLLGAPAPAHEGRVWLEAQLGPEGLRAVAPAAERLGYRVATHRRAA